MLDPSSMGSILFVSKPIAPPWNDSGKNLVRDVARGLTHHRATLMVREPTDPDTPGAAYAPVYAANSGGFAPALVDQARVLSRHSWAPAGTACGTSSSHPIPRAAWRGAPPPVCGACPRCTRSRAHPAIPCAIVPRLFADMNVALSRHTEQRLLSAGLSPERLARIAPAIEPLTPPSSERALALRDELGLPRDAPLWSIRVISSSVRADRSPSRACVRLGAATCAVMACRAKTAACARSRSRAARAGGSAGLSRAGDLRGRDPPHPRPAGLRRCRRAPLGRPLRKDGLPARAAGGDVAGAPGHRGAGQRGRGARARRVRRSRWRRMRRRWRSAGRAVGRRRAARRSSAPAAALRVRDATRIGTMAAAYERLYDRLAELNSPCGSLHAPARSRTSRVDDAGPAIQ